MWSHDIIDFKMALFISVTRHTLMSRLKLVTRSAQQMFWYMIGLLTDLLVLISLCHPPLCRITESSMYHIKLHSSISEAHKHRANDPKNSELGRVGIPLAVETYGNYVLYLNNNYNNPSVF